MQAYKKHELLYYYVNGYWYAYLTEEKYNAGLDEGVKCIRNPTWIGKFENEFNALLKKSSSYIKASKTKGKLSNKEIKGFFDWLLILIEYYSHFDPFFTDKIFAESEKDNSLKEKVKKLGGMKNFYRERLNELVVNPDSVLKSYLNNIAQNNGIPFEALYLYSIKEIYKIQEGFSLSEKGIKERTEKYAMYCNKNKFTYFSGDRANEIINKIHKEPETDNELKGISANKGKVVAKARLLEYTLEDFGNLGPLIDSMQKGEVLVTETTGPEIIAACNKAAAIVTDEGGLLSHAAIISRELGIPCVVGTKFATSLIKTGDTIEVDAENGVIKILSRN